MASKTQEAKVKFTAETKDFNKAIKDANSALTTLRSELKLNAAQAKNAGESVESLSNKQKILAQESEASRAKIAALESKLEAAKRIYGESSTEVQKLSTQLNNARAAEERIQADIQQTNNALEQQQQAAKQSESAFGRLENTINQQESALSQLKGEYANVALEQGQSSDKAQELARQIQKLSKELNDNKSELNEARTAADKLGKEFDQLEQSAKDTANEIDGMESALGALGGVGVGAAVAGLAQVEESTRQYRNEQNKLEAVAKTSGQNLGELTEAYNDLYGITGDSTLSSTAVLNMSAMGTSVEEQERIVTAATGAWAQFGDSIPIDGLLESINESSRLGATLTGPVVDAINWANMSTDEWSKSLSGNTKAQQAFNKGIAEGMTVEDAFNEALATCGSTQERQELLTDALSGAYGELGQTYRETNEDVIKANEASANMERAMGQLGEAVQPVTTWFTNLAADGLSWFISNLPVLTPLITALGVALGGLTIVAAIRSGFFGLSAILAPITGAFTALSAPVLIVVGVLAALAAVFVGLWNNSESFRASIIELWNTLVAFFQPIIEQVAAVISEVLQWALQNLVTFLEQWVVPGIQNFTTFLQTVVFPALQQFAGWFTENILPALQQLWDWFQVYILPILQQFVDFIITSVIPTLGSIAQWIFDNVVPALQDFWSWFQEHILPILQDFWSFVQENVIPALGDMANWIMENVVPALQDFWSWFSENILPVLSEVWGFISTYILPILGSLAEFVLGTVVNALKTLWGVFTNTILPVLQKVWEKIQTGIEKFNAFKSAVSEVIENAKSIVKGGLDRIAGFFKGLKFEFPKIKLPHFSVSGSFSLNPPSIPHFSVKWYADGGILTAPTIFGAMGNTLLGGGEAGHEAVLPIDKLEGYIEAVMERHDNEQGFLALADAIEGLAERVISIEIGGTQVARAIASSTDKVNGSRQNLINRGLGLR